MSRYLHCLCTFNKGKTTNTQIDYIRNRCLSNDLRQWLFWKDLRTKTINFLTLHYTKLCWHSMKFKKARLLSPQSSIFGQLLFAIYSSSITAIAQLHGVRQQQYADDTQLYVALTPADPPSELAALESCLALLQVRFLPTWHYASAVTSSGPVPVSVCLAQVGVLSNVIALIAELLATACSE